MGLWGSRNREHRAKILKSHSLGSLLNNLNPNLRSLYFVSFSLIFFNRIICAQSTVVT